MINILMLSEQFREALQMAGPAISRKSPLPILGGYLVEADRDEVRVTATDLGLGIRITVPAQVAGGGREVYNAQTLLEWVSKVGTGEMNISKQDSRVVSPTVFQAGSSRLTAHQLEADEFPVFPDWSESTTLATVEADGLATMLHSAAIATARDEGRPVLACVNLRITSEKMTASAADGFRMAFVERAGSYGVKEPVSLNIPRHSVVSLVKLIDAQKPVTIEMRLSSNGSQVLANLGSAEWVSGLVDGTFPEIEQIIPRPTVETHHEIRVNADAIQRAMAPIVGIARDNNDLVYFDFSDAGDDTSPGRIELTANAAERGNGVGRCDALITHSPAEMKRFAMNSVYLGDVLNDFKGREIVVRSAGANAAVLFHAAEQQPGQMHAHVVMPMVIGG